MHKKVWRGKMPLRISKELRNESLEPKERTGEPFPAHPFALMIRIWAEQEKGAGKSKGSYTGAIQEELYDWLERHTGDRYWGEVTFQYRESRHKIIDVTIAGPRIYHWPYRGAGSKGFHIQGLVRSYNGLPPISRGMMGAFALNKIVSHNILPLLGAGTNVHKP